MSQTIDKSTTVDGWKELEVDLSRYAGRKEWVIVIHRHLGDKPSYAWWQRLDIVADPASMSP